MDAFDALLYKDTKGDFNSKDEAILIDLLRSEPEPEWLLDIGCGDGLLTKRVKENLLGTTIIAIDTSSAQIELASKNVVEGIEFRHADIETFTSDQKLDCAYSFYAFPHIPKSQLLDALKSVRSNLNKNAKFYLFTNIALFDTEAIPPEDQEACDIEFLDGFVSQINLTSIMEMESLFDQAGLTVLKDKQLETEAKVKEYGEMISWLFVLQ